VAQLASSFPCVCTANLLQWVGAVAAVCMAFGVSEKWRPGAAARCVVGVVCVFVGLPHGLWLDSAVFNFATGQRKLCATGRAGAGTCCSYKPCLHVMPWCGNCVPACIPPLLLLQASAQSLPTWCVSFSGVAGGPVVTSDRSPCCVTAAAHHTCRCFWISDNSQSRSSFLV
jgi:hypothetical protein